MTDRTGVLVWKDYFMAQARLAEKRSKDPVCKVGATIVTDSNVIVGTGYNCMPQGKDSDFTWDKNNYNFLKDKGSFVCHAELNAIVNAKCAKVTGCTMYVTRIPCDQCAKLIVQSGIKKVYYITNAKYDVKDDAKISKEIFGRCEVPLIPWKSKKHVVNIQLQEVGTQTE